MTLCTRRKFLRTLAVSGTTVLAVSRLGLLGDSGLAVGPITSQDGVLDLSLMAQTGSVSLAGRRAALFSYNGSVPGPRLEIRPGDHVRIRFANRLPEPTNLHFHGLHVSPSGNADNVFLEIPAGEGQTYEFSLPQDHRGGTYWYHPHVHHLVARQVWAGLAGLLIVRGELDDIPEIRDADEEFLVLAERAENRRRRCRDLTAYRLEVALGHSVSDEPYASSSGPRKETLRLTRNPLPAFRHHSAPTETGNDMTPEEIIDQIVRDTLDQPYRALCYSTDEAQNHWLELHEGELLHFWTMSDSFIKRYCGPFREIAHDALKDCCSGDFDCVARFTKPESSRAVLDPLLLS
jgi:hypothetical protein